MASYNKTFTYLHQNHFLNVFFTQSGFFKIRDRCRWGAKYLCTYKCAHIHMYVPTHRHIHIHTKEESMREGESGRECGVFQSYRDGVCL